MELEPIKYLFKIYNYDNLFHTYTKLFDNSNSVDHIPFHQRNHAT